MDQIANQTLYQSMSPMVNGQMMAGQLAAAVTKDDSKFQELLERAQNPQDVELPQPAQKTAPNTQKSKEDSETETGKETAETAEKQEAVQPAQDQEKDLRKLIEAGILAPVNTVVYSETAPISNVCTEEGETGETVPAALQGIFGAGEEVVAASAEPQKEEIRQEVLSTETATPVKEETASADTQQTVQTAVQPKTEAETKVRHQAESQVQTAEADANTSDEGEVQVTEAVSQPQTVFHNVEAAPIKVGEAPAAEQSSEAPPVDVQVGAQLVQALSQGESRVEIQLNPENLGKVTVEITQSASGLIHVALNAESSQTRGLLEKHAFNIQNLLGVRGQEVQVEVQRQEETQQHQQHSYDGHNGANQQQQGRQERRQQHTQSTEDFLQQLRLGLIPVEPQ